MIWNVTKSPTNSPGQPEQCTITSFSLRFHCCGAMKSRYGMLGISKVGVRFSLACHRFPEATCGCLSPRGYLLSVSPQTQSRVSTAAVDDVLNINTPNYLLFPISKRGQLARAPPVPRVPVPFPQTISTVGLVYPPQTRLGSEW